MRTTGKKVHAPYSGSGICDICGARYPMHKLAKNADGFWACTGPGTLNDMEGLTVTELGEIEVAAAEGIDDVEIEREAAQFDLGDT